MPLLTSSKGHNVTAARDTTGATLIIAAGRNEGVPSTHITDSAGNTWTILNRTSSSSNGLGVRMYYCINPITSAAHTFTNGMGAGYSIVMAAFDDDDIVFDQDVGTNNGGGTSFTSLLVGGAGITPNQAHTLAVSACINFASGADLTNLTIASGGWTVPEFQDNGSANVDIAIAFKYVNPAAAINVPWQWTTGGEGAGRLTLFGYTGIDVGSPARNLALLGIG